MKFLRDKPLKQLGAYLIVVMLIVYIAQYFAIRQKIDRLDEAERKIDFVRSTQLANQHLNLQIQLFLHGKNDLAPAISSALNQQDHLLNVIMTGGRIDGTDHFLEPLSRLPKITLDYLYENWQAYKNSSTTLLTEEATLNSIANSTDSTHTSTTIQTLNPNFTKAKIHNEGLALSLIVWYDKLIKDLEEEVIAKNNAITRWLIGFILLDILLLGGIYYLFLKHILKPLKTLESNTSSHQHSHEFPQNEIGKVAKNINETIENLKDATDFVIAIGEGNLTIDYKHTLDNGYTQGNNTLADSLIDMQGKLKKLNEEEGRRKWANEGLTKFVEILRSSNDNISVLGDNIISALVHYTKSNQGGLYILNDENQYDKHLELIALFAFDIKKHETQKIKLGEGILGQTFLEKQTTYISNFPEAYIRITSGLGDAPPKSILIVPLKVDQDVYGLVELASFNDYQDHEIAFVERLGETIASTLANVRASQKNRQLIEQFQQQTEQMRAQEEEMRQNMEELQATQEEIARKERNYIERIQSLEAQTNTKDSSEALEHAKSEFERKEKDYLKQIEILAQQVNLKAIKGDDWAIAEELSEALKINLEALKITEQELKHKT